MRKKKIVKNNTNDEKIEKLLKEIEKEPLKLKILDYGFESIPILDYDFEELQIPEYDLELIPEYDLFQEIEKLDYDLSIVSLDIPDYLPELKIDTEFSKIDWDEIEKENEKLEKEVQEILKKKNELL